MFAKLSRRLTPSTLSLLLNIPLVFLGLHRSSFDIYNHIFFADHYRQRWFDLIEPRWFGGFSVASYPPLVHQLIALISVPFSILIDVVVETLPASRASLPSVSRYLGEEIGYVIVLLFVLALMPVAVERFAKIFVPSRAARVASWLSLALPSLYLTAYSFGQLPTLTASAALMWAMGKGWDYVRGGRRRDLFSAVLWAGVTASAHHAVLLFALIAGGAMAMKVYAPHLTGLAEFNACRIVNRPVRCYPVSRLMIWAAASAAFAAVVNYPFILWSRSYTPQPPIDHASRHNLFTDWIAFYYFFVPMYGAFLFVLPMMIIRFYQKGGIVIPSEARNLSDSLRDSSSRGTLLGMTKRSRHLPLFLASLLLFTLGLGGTTPLPSLLFGSNWEWLTYDRFSFWCGLTLLPFAGLLFVKTSKVFKTFEVLSLVVFCLFAAFSSVIIHAQPQEYDLETIARFLNQQSDRYLTFGFGDQTAKLATLTDAGTIDGSYFTARTMPELRQSGIGSLDGALWNPKGVGAIRPFLDHAHEWGVRWVFTAHIEYTVAMLDADWELMGKIAPGVLMWKNRNDVKTDWASPAAQASPDPVASIWWGVAPLTTLAAALILETRFLGESGFLEKNF